MIKPILFWSLITVLLTTTCSTEAQQPKKTPQIGYLSSFDPASDSDGTEAIRLAGLCASLAT